MEHLQLSYADGRDIKLIIHLPYDTLIASIHLKEMKIYVYENPFTRMFITALFILAKNWQVQVSINRVMDK